MSTVSRVADGLVRRGLLQRDTDPADRRRTVLLLTPKGRELMETICRGTKKYFREILQQVPAEKHQVVLERLDLLVKALRNLKGGCCP
ncbi:MAG: MarR family winged helix-turn-helix transcriptional regulator [Moorellaceae bacterium]